MYRIYVRHYEDGRKQVMNPKFKRRCDAYRFMLQQGEIIKGYEKRTGLIDGSFIVFGDDGIYKTTMWVGK